MNVADRIGLLPGTSWVADHNFWITLLICILLTPVGHLVVGIIGESRAVPISPQRQFLSFFPGDLFLAVSVAALLRLADGIEDKASWYNSNSWHVTVLMAAILLAGLATWVEWKSGVYPTRAILSPTKLYHNGVLYVGYGYVIVTTLAADIFGRGVDWKLVVGLVPGLIWVTLVAHDNSLSKKRPDQLTVKAGSAHVADWSPIWALP